MNHAWIKYTQQEVDVIVAPNGRTFTVDRPGAPIGEAIGCDTCGVPMTPEYFDLPCEPVPATL